MALELDSVSLAGRVAIVTGAAVGIGKAIAVALARFGADVAVCDRDADGLAETARSVRAGGRRCVCAVLDVRDYSAVAAFVERVADEAGPIHVLANNAGGGFRCDLLDLSANGQDALVRENFTSVTHFVRTVVPRMANAGGSIINVTSIEAHRAAPGYAVYAAMKAAVESLTKSLALELGGRGIRVNCIAPDAIPTPGVGEAMPATPLARTGRPEDVAGAAIFLASDLSAFVTGATIPVDGGGLAAGGWHVTGEGGFVLAKK